VVTVTGEPLAGVMVQVSVPEVIWALLLAVLRTAPYMTKPGSGRLDARKVPPHLVDIIWTDVLKGISTGARAERTMIAIASL
jgi:hypothetical protein